MKKNKISFVLCILLITTGNLFSQVTYDSKKLVALSMPHSMPLEIVSNIQNNAAEFISELTKLLEADTENLLVLVDKKTFLDASYIPYDLVPLEARRSYIRGKTGMELRSPAEKALEIMAAASLKEGITLIASSTYRSYDYQKTVYERNVRELGQIEADRESARPGTSQHQLGTVVDFGSITDAFADTKAGKWLVQNASAYGWSLSFPQGYESVTGYRWESWHYRYIGKDACLFQKKWFNDIQQYMLEYIDFWKKN